MQEIFFRLHEMCIRGTTKGNTQLIRQNEFSLISLNLVSRKTRKSSSLLQKIYMFIQKETPHTPETARCQIPRDRSTIFIGPWDSNQIHIFLFEFGTLQVKL